MFLVSAFLVYFFIYFSRWGVGTTKTIMVKINRVYGLWDTCIKTKVYGVICFGMELTLPKGNREYFYEWLERLFPESKEKYIRTYGNQYITESGNNKNFMRFFHRKCEENGILHDIEQIFNYHLIMQRYFSP